jgi:hypothetical protein
MADGGGIARPLIRPLTLSNLRRWSKAAPVLAGNTPLQIKASRGKLCAMKLTIIVTVVLLLSGCASHEKGGWKSQPTRNTSALKTGMPRAAILADFGKPITTSALADGGSLQVFEWRDGYSSDERMAAAYMASVNAQLGFDDKKPVEDRVRRARVWFDKNEIVTRAEVYVP